ncbi:MAG: beta-N-acetylglucosaminidase domain-containing protein [Gammaproteobacteria bacterium]
MTADNTSSAPSTAAAASAPIASGYIEGYFGRLLHFHERDLLLNTMAQNNLNTWIYAPKEDYRHRRGWREPYPHTWSANFKAFCNSANAQGVNLVAALSPIDFQTNSAHDRQKLCDKYQQLLDAGATSIGLFFDDLPQKPSTMTGIQAQQQTDLALELLDKLHVSSAQLWFCPTQYCSSFVDHRIDHSTYLPVVAEQLPADCHILWTGPQVISSSLLWPDLQEIAQLLQGRLTLWDNYYANDYAPGKLMLCSYRKRLKHIPLLLNPTGLPHTDALYLELLGRHLAPELPEQDAETIWQQVCENHGVPDSFQTIAFLFQPHAYADSSWPDLHSWPDLIPQIRELAFGTWSSPLTSSLSFSLQREWFPFLQQLARDLGLLQQILKGHCSEKDLRHFSAPLMQSILQLLKPS